MIDLYGEDLLGFKDLP